MSLTTPYIIVRVSEEGIAAVVYSADELKEARYWLTYIAEVGDALFITAANCKHPGEGPPRYSAHIKSPGSLEHNEANWRAMLGEQTAEIELQFS